MTNKAKPLDLQTDIEKAANSFEAYLDSENESPEEAQIEAEGDESVEEAVVEEELVEEEVLLEAEADDDYEEDDDELEAADETLEEEQVEEEEQEEPRYAIKVDGNAVEVTLDELKSGYSRQQDYTKKTQAIAQERKTIQQQRQNLVKSENLYKQLLPKLEAQLKSLADEPDFERLYEEDPIAYVKQKEDWNKKQELLKSTQAEQQRLQKEAQAKQAEKLQNYVAYGETQILDKVPTWRDNEVAVKEKMAIRDYAVSELGFTAEEIDQVYDYRLLLGLRDAYRFSKTKKAVRKKPAEKSSTKTRVAKPGSVTRKKTSTPLKRSKQRLAKSGKVQDAAKVFEQII